MSVKLKKGEALDNLSLTPLIDVVFLLLIFFLVSTRFAQEDRELDVQLPSASEAMPLTAPPQAIFVNINRDGQYFVDGKTLDLSEVEEVLNQAVADNPNTQSVVVRADKRVELDYAVGVFNICQRVGIQHSLTTDGGQ